MMEFTIKDKDKYIIEIDNLSSDGAGIGRINGFVVFVPGLLPGEKAEIEINKVTSSYAIGEIIKLLERSPNRIDPYCDYGNICGGCSFTHFDYEGQLAAKEQALVDAIERIGGIKDFKLDPIKGMDNPFYYRNKGQYPLAYSKGKVTTGFYARRSHDLISIDKCYTEDERAKKVRDFVSTYFEKNNIRIYNEHSHQGLVRHLVIRTSSISDDTMLILVLNDDSFVNKDTFIKELLLNCPFIVSVYFNINNKRTNVILGDKYIHIYGHKQLRDGIDGVLFDLSPASFFQINSKQTQVLYRQVSEYANLQEDTKVLDIYCGIGSIGIYLAKKNKIKSLTGVELVKEAVLDAKENAKLNNIDNAKFYQGDARLVVDKLLKEGNSYDFLIVDPPRKGCDKELLDLIIQINPKNLIYVSCNPATLARDLKYLTEKGYRLERACPVDLFPWTFHVETVCLLSKLNTEHHIEVDLELNELDLTSSESKATYEEIKDYVLKTTGLKVSSLYISQVKRKLGLEVGVCYNLPKSDNARVPECPAEKETVITAALKHFEMI